MKIIFSFFFILLISGFITAAIQPASAAPETIRGSNYIDRVNGDGTRIWSSAPEWILDSGIYKPYKLFQDANIVKIESMQGSFIFNKASCTLDFYNSGTIGGQQPTVSDSYTVLGTTLGNQNFVKVNSINNAACTTTVIESGNDIEVQGTKHVDNIGTFKIKYILKDGQDLKTQLESTNENLVWNNHKLGITQTIQVPQFVTFGDTTYNLANFNKTVLDRTWLTNHKSDLIKLSDKINFDFDIGFQYVDKITISWNGSVAKIIIDYWYNTPQILLGQTLVIDPIFTTNNPSVDGYLTDSDNDNNCETSPTAFSKNTGGSLIEVGLEASATATIDCYRGFLEFDITTIPDGVIITDSDLTYAVSSIGGSGPDFCDFIALTAQPTTASNTDLWAAISSGTVLVNADTGCNSAGNNKALDLGAAGDTYFKNQLAANWGGIGIKRDVEGVLDATFRYASLCAEESVCTPDPTLTITYNIIPNAVTVLSATRTTGTQVDLDWDAPNDNGGLIRGYKINYTIPFGNPLTVIIANTSSTATAGTVSGLTELSQYSFRVTALNSGGGGNITSAKILNVTTLKDITLGTLNLTATNPDIIPIRYQRNDINDTALFLNMTYSNTFTLSCDLYYKFAQFNNTYTSVSSTTVGSEKKSAFRFNNVDNEIIDVFCWNQLAGASNSTNVNSTNSGRYIITQTQFVLLQQIADFRNGVYGTSGMFGAVDMITLMVVIIGMIGLNRTNESVGAFFLVAVVGALWFFGVVDIIPFIGSALALGVLLAVGSTKKD